MNKDGWQCYGGSDGSADELFYFHCMGLRKVPSLCSPLAVSVGIAVSGRNYCFSASNPPALHAAFGLLIGPWALRSFLGDGSVWWKVISSQFASFAGLFGGRGKVVWVAFTRDRPIAACACFCAFRPGHQDRPCLAGPFAVFACLTVTVIRQRCLLLWGRRTPRPPSLRLR